MSTLITIEDFKALDLRVGTVREARPAEGTRQPAHVLEIDFGPLGMRTSCAQITEHYTPEDLVGRQVVAVVNFPPKKIGTIESQVLVLGAYEESGAVRLLQPDRPVANGAKLS